MVGPMMGVKPEIAAESIAGKKVRKPVVGCMSITVAMVMTRNRVTTGKDIVIPVTGEVRLVSKYEIPVIAHKIP